MQDPGKILAVDDDSNNITIIEELLDDKYELKTAASGEEALEIARDFRPDIILLDIMMPGINGYEVCKRLREHLTSEHMKIIMVSARAMASERLEGYEAGADDYITKPFDGDEFLTKIRLYMDSKPAEEMDIMSCETPSTIIDELKVPIIAVRNIISDASSNIFGSISKQMRHQLKIANDCIDIIESAISNIHDISEIHRSKEELKQSTFSMQSVVLEVIEIFKPKVNLRKVCLSADMPSEDLLVNADRKKIVKILETLVGHAIRGTHENNSINIVVQSIEDKISVDIEVPKAGIKCSKADEYIKQFDILDENAASNGRVEELTLAVARKLAELQGGRICVRHKQEGGTVLSFEFPTPTEAETAAVPALNSVGADPGIYERPEQVDAESEYMT